MLQGGTLKGCEVEKLKTGESREEEGVAGEEMDG